MGWKSGNGHFKRESRFGAPPIKDNTSRWSAIEGQSFTSRETPGLKGEHIVRCGRRAKAWVCENERVKEVLFSRISATFLWFNNAVVNLGTRPQCVIFIFEFNVGIIPIEHDLFALSWSLSRKEFLWRGFWYATMERLRNGERWGGPHWDLSKSLFN